MENQKELQSKNVGAKRSALENVRSLHDQIDDPPETLRCNIGSIQPDFEIVLQDIPSRSSMILITELAIAQPIVNSSKAETNKVFTGEWNTWYYLGGVSIRDGTIVAGCRLRRPSLHGKLYQPTTRYANQLVAPVWRLETF